MSTALVFSGQGSQYVGMLKDINEKFDEVKKKIEIANEIVGYKLSTMCFEGPESILKETRNTQPAIFLHSAINFSLTKEKLDFNAVAGHSVGEYAALYAAGVLKYEDALKLVSLRGKLMFSAGTVKPGTMFAVIGLDDNKVEEVCKKLNDPENENYMVAANYNCPGQLVVSGTADYLREHVNEFKESGARMVKELVVSGAFHSPLMEPAREQLENAINDTNFNTANVPVYVNITGEPLTSSEEIKSALIKQLTSPVKWTQTLENMNKNGFSNFIEIGPGNVLQGLVKRTLRGAEFSGVDKLEDVEKFL